MSKRRMVLLELTRRTRENRHKYYVPNERGEAFARVVGSLDPFISLYSAANGVGKTANAVNMIAECIWPTPGGHKWIKGPLYDKFPFLKRIRIVSDPSVVESIIKEMKHWFPHNRYVTAKGRKSYEAYWKTDTGFDIDIMTYDQEPKDFESANLGMIWLDEPPPRNIYKACIARLRRGGLLFITATPLAGAEWMYDEILVNPDNSEGKRAVVEATVEDACKQHGVRGHLEHDMIQKIISQYDDEEQQARVHGKFQHLTGLVFKKFNLKIHVIPPFQVNKKDFAVYHFLDPHPRTPDAAGWYAVDRKGTKYVIDELFLKCQNGDSELASRIQEKNDHYRIEGKACDPSAFIEDQHRQISLAKSLENYGLYYEPASKQREAADRRINTALGYSAVGDQIIIAPEIYIFSTCTRHIHEMTHYRWDDWTGKNALKRTAKQKPVDKDDHMIENMGRFLFSEPQFIPEVLKEEEYHEPVDDPYD